MKKHIITLGGLPGSGKSSTGKALVERLGYTRLSSGDFFREMARKRGISVEEINHLAETDTTIDFETDEWIRQKGAEENIIMDSRTAFHWIPDAFKVFLKLDTRTAAERTYAHIKNEGRVGQHSDSVEETYRNMVTRISSENRYKTLYGIDYTDESNYDLVVDTSTRSISEVADIIVAAYEKWLKESE